MSSQSISTAYNSKNICAQKLAEKCGFVKRLSSVVMQYDGEPFDIPILPIRKHTDKDFIEAYTMSAEAFHVMRLETGYYHDSVPYAPDEEIRKHCLDTADERYIYEVAGKIVGCADGVVTLECEDGQRQINMKDTSFIKLTDDENLF